MTRHVQGPRATNGGTLPLITEVNRHWREAEDKAVCTCGLLAVGYRGSWAISHVESCPVTTVYRMLLTRDASR